ncbi:MAG: MYXO-CTERM sorting domain-containing protein [Bradymonadia bacterium]
MTFAACGRGGGCGGCDSEGNFDDKDRVHSAIQVRISEPGIQFLEENLEPILAETLPEGLDICLPGDGGTIEDPLFGIDLFDWGYCQAVCDDGSNGCQIGIDIQGVDLQLIDPSTVRASITFSELSVMLDVFADGIAECTLSVNGPGFPVAVDLDLSTPDPRRDLTFSIGNPQYNLADLEIRLRSGNGGFLSEACDLIDGVINFPFIGDFILGVLQGFLDGPLEDLLNGFVEDFTCATCEIDADCPLEGGGRCVDGTCELNGACIPAPLGVEGVLDTGSLVSSVSPGVEAELTYIATPGSYVEVENNGLSLGVISGAIAEPARCVPLRAQPPTDELPRAESLRGNADPNGNPYEVGIAVSQNIVDHFMWAGYMSGTLCLTLGTDTIEQLNSTLLGALVPGLRELTRRQPAPVALTVAPQAVPAVTFGQNILSAEPNEDGQREIVDPLLTLDIPDFWLDFHVFAEGRWIRIFSLSMDISVPIAVDFTPENGIIPVLGDIAGGITNLEANNAEILAPGATERLVTLLPTLLNGLLPSLTESLAEPIELPDLLGYRLDLQEGSLRGIENNTFLGVFTALDRADANEPPPGMGARFAVETDVELLEVFSPNPADLEPGVPEGWRKPFVRVALDAWDGTADEAEMEYSWRIDGGSWSLFSATDEMVIRDPALLMQGRHTLAVRARRADDYHTLDPDPAELSFIIDSRAPIIDVDVQPETVHVSATDWVSGDDLEVRWRADDGEWQPIEAEAIIEAGGLSEIVIEATDEAGHTAEARVRTSEQGLIGRPSYDARNSDNPDSGGCDCAVTRDRSPTGTLGWMALLLAAGLLIRRRRMPRSGASLKGLMTALVALLAIGCSDSNRSGDGEGESDARAPIKPDMGAPIGEIDCVDDNDCDDPNQFCRNVGGRDVCAVVPCDGNPSACDMLACPEGENALCNPAGICECEAFCAGGCGDGEYCCLASNSCEPTPAACADVTCDPGFELMVTDNGTVNPMSCALDGTVCACVEQSPLDPGRVGRHSDMVVAGEVAYVSAYAEDYGDLVVGRLNPEGDTTWWWVDGVPEGDVVAGPNGPRGGVEDEGPDVGIYTAIARADDGTLHVAYHDLDEGTLKYAHGAPEGDAFTWTTLTLDEAEGSGAYASISLDNRGVPGVAYRVAEIADGDATVSELRYRLARNPNPATANDWNPAFVVATSPVEGEGDGTYPEGTGLFTTQARTPDGLPVLAWYDRTYGQLWWSRLTPEGFDVPELLAGWGHPERDGDMGTNVDIAVDAGGNIHLCYQDGTTDSLRYLAPALGLDEWVDDGVRTNYGGREHAIHVVGEDCNIDFDSENNPVIVYQDATGHDVVMARRVFNLDGEPSWNWEILAGNEPTYQGSMGFYTRAAIEAGVLWVSHYFYNTQAEPAQEGLGLLRFRVE